MTRITAPAVLLTLLLAAASHHAGAQILVPPVNNVAGVRISAEGHVEMRQQDATEMVAAQRLRARALTQASSKSAPPATPAIVYVSLTKALAEARSLIEQKKEIPDNLRYLSGMTQLRYVFVYPDDLVIAGPAEPFDAKNKLSPTGKVTGRPVMHLEDIVVALQWSADRSRLRQPLGCRIDPPADAMDKSNQVMKDMASATRGARMKAMREAIGPQKVTAFGAPPDSRLEFVTVAADYLMKRQCAGLEPIPVPGVGSAVDASRPAANRFWFEGSYEPLLVSADGDAFELRGPRLVLYAGEFSFDPKGATDTAKTFAKNFSARMTQLATVVPAYADLQNVADVSVVAALIRKDGLDKKSGTDLSWLNADGAYPVTKMPVPRTADTVVNYTNGSIVAGGVVLKPTEFVAEQKRERDAKGVLAAVRGKPSGDNWWRSSAPLPATLPTTRPTAAR
jgi:hypothetical protein